MARKEIVYKGEIFSVAYDILNFSGQKTAIFLHGWGSSRALMKRVFSPHFLEYRQLYIDLIGFGDSGEPAFPLNSDNYRDIVEIFLQEIEFPKETIIGHSFGGKVATLLRPKNLILLSSAGVIEEKPLSVRLKILLFKTLKKLGFAHLRNLFVSDDGKNLSQNMYETFKRVIKEDFRDEFSRVESNTLLFWGEDDRATSLQSGETIHQLIGGSKLFPLHGDHFFFIHHTQFISGEIQKRVSS